MRMDMMGGVMTVLYNWHSHEPPQEQGVFWRI